MSGSADPNSYMGVRPVARVVDFDDIVFNLVRAEQQFRDQFDFSFAGSSLVLLHNLESAVPSTRRLGRKCKGQLGNQLPLVRYRLKRYSVQPSICCSYSSQYNAA